MKERFDKHCEEKQKLYYERSKFVRLELEQKTRDKFNMKMLENLNKYFTRSVSNPSNKLKVSKSKSIKYSNNLSYNIHSVDEKSPSVYELKKNKEKSININIKKNKVIDNLSKDYFDNFNQLNLYPKIDPSHNRTFYCKIERNDYKNNKGKTHHSIDKLKEKFLESFESNKVFLVKKSDKV